MLKLTDEEKQKYAKLLRNPNNLVSPVTDEYFDILNEIETEQFTVTGRDGFEIPVWMMKPKNEKNDMLYINVHGGGFVQTHSRFDSAFCAHTAKRLGCTVIDVDYRLAPEYPYPIGLQDTYDVYKWAIAHAEALKISPKKIVLGGNSSGAQFCAAISMIARKEQISIPAICVMLYPVCSICSIEDLSEEMDLTEVMNRGKLYNLLYCEKESDFNDSYVSLLNAAEEELKGFPPMILATGGKDPLAPDAEEFAKRVAAASGARVVMRRFPNSKHGFLNRCLGDEWQQGREFVFSEIEYLLTR